MLVDKAEAARRLGVSVDTVERRLKRGELQGQQEQRAKGWRWLIEVPGDGAPADAPANNGFTPADAPASGIDAPADPALLNAFQAQIDHLQEQVKSLNHQLTVKDNQISELLIVTRQTQAMLPPPPAAERRRSFWGWLWGGN